MFTEHCHKEQKIVKTLRQRNFHCKRHKEQTIVKTARQKNVHCKLPQRTEICKNCNTKRMFTVNCHKELIIKGEMENNIVSHVATFFMYCLHTSNLALTLCTRSKNSTMSSNIARLQHNAISSFPLVPSHLLTLHNLLGVCHISYDMSKVNMTLAVSRIPRFHKLMI